MGDKNPIPTLGDYSKPSYEGYRNTIELPIGNNVDPNQHLKDFQKLVDSLDLNGENRERTRLCLFQFSLRDQARNWIECLPAGSITTWEDLTTQFLAQFFPQGRTAKLRNDILMFQEHHGESLSETWTQRPDKAWTAIERLAQYEDEGWNDALIPDEDAISLMGKSESVFRLTSNKMYQPPSEPSRQEEFEHIVMNFIFDQEERITQLEDYMQVIVEEFMEFSSEVTRRLKERIKENENKPRKIEKIIKYPDTKVMENSAKHDFLENLKKKTFPNPANLLCVRYIRLIHWNPSQPWKNIFGFKLGERDC
ncbi:zinc finger, CCHC-type containing protein [Tanacetum coccineum]